MFTELRPSGLPAADALEIGSICRDCDRIRRAKLAGLPRLAFAECANAALRASPTIVVAPHRLADIAQDARLTQQIRTDIVLWRRSRVKQCKHPDGPARIIDDQKMLLKILATILLYSAGVASELLHTVSWFL